MKTDITIEEMASFCKRKGIVYPSSEIYGGLTGFFDYGPYGSEIKKNLKDNWWKYHVHARDDIVGIDGSIITHPKVWVASGHVGCFADLMIECSNKDCKEKLRADVFLEENVEGLVADGMKANEINKLIKKHNLKCPKCNSEFKEAEDFNLMFKTNVGPKSDGDSVAYLRPETAQVIFADFKHIVENARLKLPFGIAQMGKAYRNEISPRNFLFRCREFEQMEIEYFVHPDKVNECPYIEEVYNHKMKIYDEQMQKDNSSEVEMTMKEALDKGIIKTQWHAYWLATEHKWFKSLGANPNNFRARQHISTEKSHYALDTWDLEYNFPWGWKELQGMANRTDFDLKQHIEHSKQDLSIFDEEKKERFIPHVVAEPSQGVDRAFLVFMFDAYEEHVDEKTGKTVVLHLHPKLAPCKVAIFPLVKKEPLANLAKEIHKKLQIQTVSFYDQTGSIGKRYARQDEIGTPYCITIDFESLEDNMVTIRDRDSQGQKRIKIEDINSTILNLIEGNITFDKI